MTAEARCLWCPAPAMPRVGVCVEHGIGNLHKYLAGKSPEECARWAREWGDTNAATQAVAGQMLHIGSTDD
jgi:hypothetical protein